MKRIKLTAVLLLFTLIISLCDYHGTRAVISASVNADSLKTVIIDAGHGGFDGGALTDDGTPEKDINLSISLYLEDYLNMFGINTVMIRETDCSVEDEGLDTIRKRKVSDLHNRMNVMKTTPNAIYVSIHQNHFSEKKYKGLQVFYSPGFSDESSKLANTIQQYAVEYLQPDNTREIKQCGTSVYLIYNAVCPAVLVECGFLSNDEEAALLKTSDYQKQIAMTVTAAIIEYISKTDTKV